MSDDEPEVFEWTDDDGSLLGYIAQDEDGDYALLSPDDGSVIAWYDGESGELMTDDDDDDAEDHGYSADDGYDELEARLQAVEEAAAQPRQVEYVETPDTDGQLDDALIQADYAESVLDRPMLLSEQRAFLREYMADQAAGRDPDADAISERLVAMNDPDAFVDLDTGDRGQDHRSRTDYIVQRLQDQERAENAAAGLDDLTEDEPPGRGGYDVDSHEERAAFIADRVRGAADSSDTYSSSIDYPEE